ncbi:MAG: hypothetical protein ACAH59_11770 [Pseudobdellovibrionaceae bacterium]
MKRIFAVLIFILLNGGLVYAGFGDFIADVATLGQHGRDNDEAAKRAEAEKEQLRLQQATQVREVTIEQYSQAIHEANLVREEFIQNKANWNGVFDDLKATTDLFQGLLSGQVQSRSLSGRAKVSSEQLQKDLAVLRIFLEQPSNKRFKSEAFVLLVDAAVDENLSVGDFIERTVQQSNMSLIDLRKTYDALMKWLPQFKANAELHDQNIQRQDAIIATSKARLNELLAAKAAAAQAVEQERIQREQRAERDRQTELANARAFDKHLQNIKTPR